MTTMPAGATWRIRAGEEETTAIWDPPAAGGPGPVVVCAHGAGGHMADRAVLAMTAALRQRGIGTVRFNFFYRARGSGRPDSMPRLLACFQAVVAQVQTALAPRVLILGGRSMGARAASVLVSEGAACQGLLLLAYPLHPPGQPAKLRAAHLANIEVPVLCINGTRDAFCDRQLMTQVLGRLRHNWRMHWLEGADHGFHVLKRTGRTDDDIVAEAAEACQGWLASVAISN
jgi:predicted alpha/beta-hydrolase family hydrolase